jgi:hypothetical protein
MRRKRSIKSSSLSSHSRASIPLSLALLFHFFRFCLFRIITSHAPLSQHRIAIHAVRAKSMASQLRPRAMNATAFSTASTSAAATTPSAAVIAQRRPRIGMQAPFAPTATISGSRLTTCPPVHRHQRRCGGPLVPTAVPIMSTQSSDDDLGGSRGSSSGSGSGSGGPEDKPAKKFSHRWQVVGMMALAFVLCNMDKV